MAAVIISNGATTLATASGFYRVEAHNLSMFSATLLSLTSTRTIAVTFANAGACQGIVLCITHSAGNVGAGFTLKSVIVTLQENVASVWTDRAAKTLTSADMLAGYNSTGYLNNPSINLVLAFTGGTFPYTVDTASNKWRFQVTQGAGTTDSQLRTSDATNPFYATWCNNAVTFASNDCIICKDIVTIDMTATLKGVLGTGDSTTSVCGIICSNMTDPTADNVAFLRWANPPVASYTLTIDGQLFIASRAGFRIGTSASRIPTAQKAIVSVIAATSGTSTNTGFLGTIPASISGNRTSLHLYGEIPTVRNAKLAADAATGQANIVTDVSTGWVNGDKVFVGGQDITGNASDGTIYTVSSVSGTTVTLTANLATVLRKSTRRVVRLNGYGIEMLGPVTAINCDLRGGTNVVASGVRFQGLRINSTQGSVREDWRLLQTQIMEYCSVEGLATAAFAGVYLSTTYPVGCVVDHCDMVKAGGQSCWPLTGSAADQQWTVSYTNNIVLAAHFWTGGNGMLMSAQPGQTVTDNFFENTTSAQITLNGVRAVVKRNDFFGCATAAIELVVIFDSVDIGSNVFNKCAIAYRLNTGRFRNVRIKGDTFGNITANTSFDISMTGVSCGSLVFDSPVAASLNFSNVQGALVEGSWIAIAGLNNTPNNDVAYDAVATWQKCGTGLTDTTSHTAGSGKYALRCAPNGVNPGQPCVWRQFLYPGRVQPITISVWVYIANAAFYAGTHTKPTLIINYDDGTSVSSVAAGSTGWQQLSVSFTPATATPFLEVIVQASTDATGTNAYFYIDDFAILYAQPDAQSLDLWAMGQPIPLAPSPPVARAVMVQNIGTY